MGDTASSAQVDSQDVSTSVLSSTPPLSMSHQLSTPPCVPSLKLSSSPASFINEGATTTAPLKIVKRTPSNPNSPLPQSSAISYTSGPSSDSISRISPDVSPVSILTTEDAEPNTPVTLSTHDFLIDAVRASRNSANPPSTSERSSNSSGHGNGNVADETRTPPLPPSELDIFTAADTTYDDLASSHPGRFSRFSMSSALAIPALLGKTGQSPVIEEVRRDSSQDVSARSVSRRSAGRTILSVAARGKVDEATLASTQAQVGIGLSLLQDLVGGMCSDSESESGSDYNDSEDERSRRVVSDAYSIAFGNAVKHDSVSIAAESSTAEGLKYANEGGGQESSQISHIKDEGQVRSLSTCASPSPQSNVQNATPLSPATSPAVSKFPQSQSQQVNIHTTSNAHDQNFTDLLERERRPSLAPSVVSGISGVSVRSGTSGSWDGDIYDNYRYSRFSNASAAVVTGRPSMDSVRTRADSVGMNGRLRSESIGMAFESKAVVEEPPVIDDAVYPPPLSFAQDSREFLKQLHNIGNFPGSLPEFAGPMTRTSPDHSPDVDTEVIAELSPLLPVKNNNEDSTAGKFLEGVASAVRQRLETERLSPLPQEIQCTKGNEVNSNDLSNASLFSADFAKHIVVDDDDELPSKILADGILADGQECEDYEDGDTFQESNEGTVEGRIIGSPEPLGNTEDIIEDVRATKSLDGERRSRSFAAEPTCSQTVRDEELNKDGVSSASNSQPVQSISPVHHPTLVKQRSREQLSEHQQPTHLRPRDTISAPLESVGRRSLFMPHPNAPKAPAGASINISPGVGVGTIPQGQPSTIGLCFGSQPRQLGHKSLPPQLRPTVQAVIRMALSIPPRTDSPTPGRPPVRIWPTIYGRTDTDLSSSVGPVPITFSLDPPAAIDRGKATAPRSAALPPIGTGHSIAMSSTSSNSGVLETIIKVDDKSNTKSEMLIDIPKQLIGNNALTPIPRPNFVPKVGVVRPRSRSFSGFNAPSSTVNVEKKYVPIL